MAYIDEMLAQARAIAKQSNENFWMRERVESIKNAPAERVYNQIIEFDFKLKEAWKEFLDGLKGAFEGVNGVDYTATMRNLLIGKEVQIRVPVRESIVVVPDITVKNMRVIYPETVHIITRNLEETNYTAEENMEEWCRYYDTLSDTLKNAVGDMGDYLECFGVEVIRHSFDAVQKALDEMDKKVSKEHEILAGGLTGIEPEERDYE